MADSEKLVRTIGNIKLKKYKDNFDYYHDFYEKKAKELGYSGELKFNIEKGKVVILAVIE